MAETAVEIGDVEPIIVDARATGRTVRIRIRRVVDGFFLDWSDNTFKPVGVVATLDQGLTEIDATNLPGLYALASPSHPLGLNTAILTNLSTTTLGSLTVYPTITVPVTGFVLDPGEIKLVPRVDGLVPARTVLSRLNSMARGRVTLTGSSPAPSQIAEYFDETGATSFKNDNTGDQRNPAP